MAELILALDMTDKDQALVISESCAPYLDKIKVGYPLILSSGMRIVNELKSLRLPLIADFKVADIPNTNKLICHLVFKAGFDAIIIHGFTGSDSVKACVDIAHEFSGECYVVTEMSHPGAVKFFSGIANDIATIAMQCGADGIIAPATRPERIVYLRTVVGSKKIYAPGIGIQGGELKKVVPLVDGVIIGRAIYEAPDPSAAAQRFADICQ